MRINKKSTNKILIPLRRCYEFEFNFFKTNEFQLKLDWIRLRTGLLFQVLRTLCNTLGCILCDIMTTVRSLRRYLKGNDSEEFQN